MTVELRPHQVVAVNDIYEQFDQGYQNVLSVLSTGAGKCHGKDTPIMMFNGTIKMVQDVKVGDLLMGPDSKPREVLTLARGREELFKVTPVKGDPYVVNKSHILSLKKTGTSSKPKYKCQEGKGEIVNIPLTEYIDSSKSYKHKHKGWRTGVEFEGVVDDKFLPPYLLGLWLGDGNSRTSSITTADKEIVNYLKNICYLTGQDLRIEHQPNNASSNYHITGQRRRSNTTMQSLHDNNLVLNKHIPQVFKTANRSQRLKLLAGILDSDGHLTKGYYDVIFKNKRLAEDTVFLARSLGFASYITECTKVCTNNGVKGVYHRFSISGNVCEIPTKLKRHQPGPRKQKKNVLVTGISVESIGEGDYYGFTITGDHLYLLGDFTVTHNTIIKAHFASQCYDDGETCVLIAHRDVLLGQISEALCLYQVPHSFICSDATKRDITNLNYKKFGNHYHNERSKVIVISVATFAARLRDGKIPQKLLDSVKMWLMDECFLEGVMINTPEGKKPIQEISIGDKVTSLDETTGKFHDKEVTKVYKNKLKGDLVKISTKGHHVLTCTVGHPILTKRGWIPAGLLTLTDEVLVNGEKQIRLYSMQKTNNENNRVSEIQISKSSSNLLQSKMFISLAKRECGEEYTGTASDCEMSHVFRKCEPGRFPFHRVQEERSSILQSGMFEQVSFDSVERNDVRNEQKTCIGENENEQSNVQTRMQRKDDKNSQRNESSTETSWWEWSTSHESRNETIRTFRVLRFFSSGNRIDWELSSRVGLSCALQNRLWFRKFENCNRSRRFVTSIIESKRSRQEERQSFAWFGLESVSILEQNDTNRTSDCFVYNIEVDELHTYIADDVIVHNCHHLTQGSQWGKCIESFPNARGLGVTATPIRGDKKGLGRKAQGYFDYLSDTSSMLKLVKQGRLTPMKIYAPTQLDVGDLKTTAGGDYNQKKLYEKTKSQGSKITGSAVEYYNRFIHGQPAITFAVNIEHGKCIAKKFNEAGIPTAFVSSKSKESERKKAVEDLRSGVLWNLVNVDLFGEGFDAPAVAAVFLLRKTESYSLFKQQIGRCLRPSEGKEFGYVFDHVGNVKLMLEKYGLESPYHDPEWTLESYGKTSTSDSSDLPKMIECPHCSYEGPLFDLYDEDGDLVFKGFKQHDGSYICPDEECGYTFDDEENELVVKKIQEKQGELVELDFSAVDELIRKRDEEIFKPVSEMSTYGQHAAANMSRHVDRQNAIVVLKRKINNWCNTLYKETGWSSELIRREFEITFKTNIFQAQVLSAPKATKLATKVQQDDIKRSKTLCASSRTV